MVDREIETNDSPQRERSLEGSSSASLAFETSLGRVRMHASERGIVSVRFDDSRDPGETEAWSANSPHLAKARDQILAYLQGERRRFDVPLDPLGTPFQRAVWQALLEIPYGEWTTYRELARRLGRPKAARAVGAANGRNAIAILLPCHRVLGSDGALRGYAGGTWRKRALLELERAHLRLGDGSSLATGRSLAHHESPNPR